jgi:hypothetical protein
MEASDAVELFEQMARECIISPTNTRILTVYNHAGLVEKEGYRCFNSVMDNDIAPSVDHYGIVDDLSGRAG